MPVYVSVECVFVCKHIYYSSSLLCFNSRFSVYGCWKRKRNRFPLAPYVYRPNVLFLLLLLLPLSLSIFMLRIRCLFMSSPLHSVRSGLYYIKLLFFGAICEVWVPAWAHDRAWFYYFGSSKVNHTWIANHINNKQKIENITLSAHTFFSLCVCDVRNSQEYMLVLK